MLKAVRGVRDEVTIRCKGGVRTLEIISKVFETLTIFDEIAFVPYDTPPSNPIWGRFSRWSRSPGVYAPAATMVEVGYASHLSEDWRRFVVCKELCHALEVSTGAAVSNANIDGLVTAFAIRSASGDLKAVMATFASELLAEIGAIELLFPLPDREAILTDTPKPDAETKAALARQYKIPGMYIETALSPVFNQTIKPLFE